MGATARVIAARIRHFRSGQRGVSLVDLLVTMTLMSIVSGIAVGVTAPVVRVARGEAGAQELDGFLRRQRGLAVARRRDIEVRFVAPNQVQSAVRAVPDPPNATPAPTILETMTFEGRVEYLTADGVPDTPSRFGNDTAVRVGGTLPVMFSSEGAFLDATGNPANATLSLGIDGEPLSHTAVTVLGTTGTIQRWRWTGAAWAR